MRFAIFWMGLAVTASGVDLKLYPFEQQPDPASFETLRDAEKATLKVIESNYVKFLLLAPCRDGDSKPCLWAQVDPLFAGSIVVKKSGRALTLYSQPDPKRKFASTEVLVRVCQDACPGTTVSGHASRVTHWITLEDEEKAIVPPIPMVWLPTSKENQKRINADYHMAYRSGQKKRVVLYYNDLQAPKDFRTPGFFVIIGYDWLSKKLQTRHFVVAQHSTEKETYTGKIHGAVRTKDDPFPTLIALIGHTIVTNQESGQPEHVTRLELNAEKPVAVSGRITEAVTP